jgi:hypothetical protein
MSEWFDKITGANSRPASPLDTERQSGRALCAPPSLSAAVQFCLAVMVACINKPIAIVLLILALAVSGYALTRHHPRIEFPESGRAMLHFEDSMDAKVITVSR